MVRLSIASDMIISYVNSIQQEYRETRPQQMNHFHKISNLNFQLN